MAALLTPSDDGRLEPPRSGRAVVPVACYLEGHVDHASIEYIGDIWADAPRIAAMAAALVDSVMAIGRDVIVRLHGRGDETVIGLYVDVALAVLGMAAQHMLRLEAASRRGVAAPVELRPACRHFVFKAPSNAAEYRRVHRDQAYQWMLLRRVAGADDEIAFRRSRIDEIGRSALNDLRCWARSWRPGEARLYGGYLGKARRLIEQSLGPFPIVPDLVRATSVGRSGSARRVLHDCFAAHAKRFCAKFDLAGDIEGPADIFATIFPASRLEHFRWNLAVYERYVRRSGATGLVTAEGVSNNDDCLFFLAACNRAGLPSVVLQHGGQYGYDDKMPHSFLHDLCLPTHFVSWGWGEYPGLYDKSLQRARIVPLPAPRLSDTVRSARAAAPAKNNRMLLVPLSKARTIDQRFAGVATDGALLPIRQAARAVIEGAGSLFDEILVTYREKDFSTDPLGRELERTPLPRTRVASSRNGGAATLMEDAAAVFWDVATTGMLETLARNIPTVVLMRPGRWAEDVDWAERLMIESGIGVYTAGDALASLRRFVYEPDAWASAREQVQPVLEAFGRTADDWQVHWRSFFAWIDNGARGEPPGECRRS